MPPNLQLLMSDVLPRLQELVVKQEEQKTEEKRENRKSPTFKIHEVADGQSPTTSQEKSRNFDPNEQLKTLRTSKSRKTQLDLPKGDDEEDDMMSENEHETS